MIRNSEFSLYNVRKKARHKHYNLSSMAIWNMGRATIEGIQSFGNKFYSKESKSAIKKLFTYQNKLARLACGALQSTDLRDLEKLLHYKPMQLRVNIALVNYIEECVRAPPYYQKHHSIRQYAEFTNNNLDTAQTTAFMKKSVFSRAIDIRSKLKFIDNFTYQPLVLNTNYCEEKYPIPCYTIQYPRGLDICYDFDETIKKVNNNNSYNWWTDGSCFEYIGGFAFVTLQVRAVGELTSFYGYIPHKTEINYCELNAIDSCLNEILTNDDKIYDLDIDYITIFTDSKSCLNQLDINGYPKSDLMYNVIINIFDKVRQLNTLDKIVRLVKVPAHEGYTGNELADWWAKYGVYMAQYDEKQVFFTGEIGSCPIYDEYIPLNVQKEINEKAISKIFYEERDKQYEKRNESSKQKGRKRIGSKYIKTIARSNTCSMKWNICHIMKHVY